MDRRAGLGCKARRGRDREVAAPVPSLRLRIAPLLLAVLSAVACSSQHAVPPQPDPAALLQSIPAADSAHYNRIDDMKKWRNPYLIVRADGVALYDSADSAEILLKTDEVLPALARLPASNWPYGRVVAAAEIGVRASEQEGIAIRRNKGIVGGLLESAHVAIRWVPSA
jgi:hypothetical protein